MKKIQGYFRIIPLQNNTTANNMILTKSPYFDVVEPTMNYHNKP